MSSKKSCSTKSVLIRKNYKLQMQKQLILKWKLWK